MSGQLVLYLYNRLRLQDPMAVDCSALAFERQWIEAQLEQIPPGHPCDLPALEKRLTELIAREQSEPSPRANYVGERMSRHEFRILVQEFAVDGLTEAQVFYYILPRLPLPAQMPMLRILIDEFGCGNLQRAHTTLYVNLLQELGMPTLLDAYIERVEPEGLAFVNLFFWLTLRADDPSYFAGALTYLETAIPSFFECYVRACSRLGIRAHAYYSEHQHIDAFHAIEGRRLLRALDASHKLDPGAAWLGIRLASLITATAFDAAVEKARRSCAVACV